jgi:MFS transporter, DHA2 family, multidrug resistance protein
VSDASGLYNLSRNLGGAIGIAVIDTVVFSRSEIHSGDILDLIGADPGAAAALLRIPPGDLPDASDTMGLISIGDLISAQSLAMAVNDAWLLLAGITALALPLLFIMGPIRPTTVTSSALLLGSPATVLPIDRVR